MYSILYGLYSVHGPNVKNILCHEVHYFIWRGCEINTREYTKHLDADKILLLSCVDLGMHSVRVHGMDMYSLGVYGMGMYGAQRWHARRGRAWC